MKKELLIIGGVGDLAIRKLYPALFSLELAGELQEVTRITGISRKPRDHSEIYDAIHTNVRESDIYKDEAWEMFISRLNFIEGDATNKDCLINYANDINLEETELIVYFAIPPNIFEKVCKALHDANMVTPNTRVVVEKPLGSNSESFIEINDQLSKIFSQEQVYRIDHYLGKESVQNLLALRFANIIFGSIWEGDLIDHVQISVAETIGVQDRYEFYDSVGALRDMVQNHLLQILCLIAIEPPANRSAEMIRAEKLKILQSLKPITPDMVNTYTVRGQYTKGSIDGENVLGYQDEIGANDETTTETFVALKVEIENWRWANVPFYLRTGKCLANKCSEILIQFKPPKHNIFKKQTAQLASNQLLIRLYPNEGVQLRILNRHPGLGDAPMMDALNLNLDIPDSHKWLSFESYARLLLEVMKGDQTLFVSSEEVKASWEWIDQIRESWDIANTATHLYKAGSMGPSQSIAMMARDGREWADNSFQ